MLCFFFPTGTFEILHFSIILKSNMCTAYTLLIWLSGIVALRTLESQTCIFKGVSSGSRRGTPGNGCQQIADTNDSNFELSENLWLTVAHSTLTNAHGLTVWSVSATLFGVRRSSRLMFRMNVFCVCVKACAFLLIRRFLCDVETAFTLQQNR